ncbi:MAG: S-adenosylmethionine:tRNA ribosyltransferase-isomerase, partial [Planctomycetota bacterium]
MDSRDLDYELPPDRIAQEPAPNREDARLLAFDRGSGEVRHLWARDFPSLLGPGDLLVLNESRVLPVR